MVNQTVNSLPSSSVPWGRKVESRLDDIESTLGIHTDELGNLAGQVDKSVTAFYETPMTFANGISGKQVLTTPTSVQFVSGTGMFQVTVSMEGLSQAGANIGFGFEAPEFPFDSYFGLPKYGVSGSSAQADNRYIPLALSRSTTFTTRPGVYGFSLYALVDTTITASSQAYLLRGQISVRAV